MVKQNIQNVMKHHTYAHIRCKFFFPNSLTEQWGSPYNCEQNETASVNAFF